MRRGIVVLPVVGLLVAVLALSNLLRPQVDAQDRTDERLIALETRVAVLETVVADGATGAAGGVSAATHELSGKLNLVSAEWTLAYDGDQCGPSRFSRLPTGLVVGARVTVRDENGEVIAIGEILASEATIDVDLGSEGLYQGTCSLAFTVENVPTAAFYEIEAAGHVIQLISYEELEAQDWTVVLEASDRI